MENNLPSVVLTYPDDGPYHRDVGKAIKDALDEIRKSDPGFNPGVNLKLLFVKEHFDGQTLSVPTKETADKLHLLLQHLKTFLNKKYALHSEPYEIEVKGELTHSSL